MKPPKPFSTARYFSIVCGLMIGFALMMPWLVLGFVRYLEWVGSIAR